MCPHSKKSSEYTEMSINEEATVEALVYPRDEPMLEVWVSEEELKKLLVGISSPHPPFCGEGEERREVAIPWFEIH